MTKDKEIRIAIIGTGMISERHMTVIEIIPVPIMAILISLSLVIIIYLILNELMKFKLSLLGYFCRFSFLFTLFENLTVLLCLLVGDSDEKNADS